MDDRLEQEHDFKKTIREAADIDGDRRIAQRSKRLDAEMAYETLAVNASMGAFGMDETVGELIGLQMTEELLYKTRLENDPT